MPVHVSLHSVALSYLIQASCWLLLAILLVHVSFSPALTSRRIKSGFSLPTSLCSWTGNLAEPDHTAVSTCLRPHICCLQLPCSISCQWGFQCLMQRLLGHFSLCTAVPLWYKQPWTLPKCYWTDATLCYISLTELHKWGCMLSRVDSNQEVDSSSGLHVKDTETSCPWCIGVCEWILGLKQRKITCFTLWKTKCSIILVIQHKIRIIALLTKKGSEMYCRKYVVHRLKW